MMDDLVNAPILIDGASGYVGSHLAFHLTSRGHLVRCLVRPQTAQSNIDYLQSFGAHVVKGDLSDDTDEILKAFDDCANVVHLIGSIAPRRAESYASLHAQKTAELIELCKRHKVEKVVMVSALGSSPSAANQYHQTKWDAEEELRSSGLKHVILQPSLIVGRVHGSRDSKMVKRYFELVTMRQVVPLINGGTNKIQPIYIMDLVEAIASCFDGNCQLSGTFELGGPEVLTMRNFVEELMRALGVFKPIVSLPVPLAHIIAWLSETLQDVPIVSRQQILLTLADNICKTNAIEEVFGISPVSCREALATYKVRPTAQSILV